jgi:hypothetical protein
MADVDGKNIQRLTDTPGTMLKERFLPMEENGVHFRKGWRS